MSGTLLHFPAISGFYHNHQRAHWHPSTSPYAYVLNNSMNLIDPTGMSSEDPEGISGIKSFFQKLGNWMKGDGWVETPLEGFELEEVEVVDPNGKGEICSACPEPRDTRQNYGRDQYGENDEQGIKWPDAIEKGDPVEMIPFPGPPGKAPHDIGRKVLKALDNIRKWIEHFTKDEIAPSSPDAPQNDSAPRPPKPEMVIDTVWETRETHHYKEKAGSGYVPYDTTYEKVILDIDTIYK